VHIVGLAIDRPWRITRVATPPIPANGAEQTLQRGPCGTRRHAARSLRIPWSSPLSSDRQWADSISAGDAAGSVDGADARSTIG
jgi:hypothetical protein